MTISAYNDNQLIIADSVAIYTITDIDTDFADCGTLADITDLYTWNAIATALDKGKIVILVTGKYHYDYDGGLVMKALDYKVI